MTTTLMTPTTSADLVDVLTPQVERLYERHLATTKSWLPPEKRPSVIKPTESPNPAPTSAAVGANISRIPGPPLGPS